jgi:hypothetical protein
LPLSAEESGVSKKYTTFNWDKWKVKAGRDFDLMNCLDKPIELPACRDLNEVPASQLKDTCLKAMPPTRYCVANVLLMPGTVLLTCC